LPRSTTQPSARAAHRRPTKRQQNCRLPRLARAGSKGSAITLAERTYARPLQVHGGQPFPRSTNRGSGWRR
jgi:hypothetical protein